MTETQAKNWICDLTYSDKWRGTGQVNQGEQLNQKVARINPSCGRGLHKTSVLRRFRNALGSKKERIAAIKCF
jgi:hypothetical protein